jgi:mannonate dehydratase
VKITEARVIVTSPGRNFVTLKIVTDEGVTGVGDATLNGRELAVAAYLTEHVVPLLIGRPADRIEDTWQYLYKAAYWRGGPVGMAAIAAVDTALWDIKGKVAGLPVYQLLGGASRDGVTVYGHADGETVEDALQEVDRFLQAGYRAVRVQVGVPGVATYGLRKGRSVYEPADADLPTEGTWSTERYLRHVPSAMERVRAEFGYDFHLLHDVHHRLTPIQAAGLGKRLEDSGLYWMEDPVPAELQEGFRLIRQHTTSPIAVGEVFSSVWNAHQLITEQLIDFIRATVVHAGGITHLRRIFALAELYHVRSGSHGATDLSPVCMAAQVHLGMAIPNFGLQEYMGQTEETDAVFPHSHRLQDGMLLPSEAPGLGVDIDEELAAQYPYRRAYLPVARLEDGTVASW